MSKRQIFIKPGSGTVVDSSGNTIDIFSFSSSSSIGSESSSSSFDDEQINDTPSVISTNYSDVISATVTPQIDFMLRNSITIDTPIEHSPLPLSLQTLTVLTPVNEEVNVPNISSSVVSTKQITVVTPPTVEIEHTITTPQQPHAKCFCFFFK